MLLFSTVLDINPTLTVDSFIRLAICFSSLCVTMQQCVQHSFRLAANVTASAPNMYGSAYLYWILKQAIW